MQSEELVDSVYAICVACKEGKIAEESDKGNLSQDFMEWWSHHGPHGETSIGVPGRVFLSTMLSEGYIDVDHLDLKPLVTRIDGVVEKSGETIHESVVAARRQRTEIRQSAPASIPAQSTLTKDFIEDGITKAVADLGRKRAVAEEERVANIMIRHLMPFFRDDVTLGEFRQAMRNGATEAILGAVAHREEAKEQGPIPL